MVRVRVPNLPRDVSGARSASLGPRLLDGVPGPGAVCILAVTLKPVSLWACAEMWGTPCGLEHLSPASAAEPHGTRRGHSQAPAALHDPRSGFHPSEPCRPPGLRYRGTPAAPGGGQRLAQIFSFPVVV